MPERRSDSAPEQPTEPAADSGELWQSERIVSDAIGRLMVLWGFKRNMGRVWTVLYLADHPLSAGQLRERLQLSTGAVSMTLTELGLKELSVLSPGAPRDLLGQLVRGLIQRRA